MQKKYIYSIAGASLFVLSIFYIVWHQTSVVNKIFTDHRNQLQTEIKAIQNERFVLRKLIDSFEFKINSDKNILINDIDSFLKKYGKK